LKMKFAMSGAIATGLDYGLYLFLVNYLLAPVPSNTISYSVGMVANFIMQRRFVFSLERSVSHAFMLSVMVSLGGLLLSNGIIFGLNRIEFLAERQYITKLIATGLVFFYNFYLKRYVFEKRFFGEK